MLSNYNTSKNLISKDIAGQCVHPGQCRTISVINPSINAERHLMFQVMFMESMVRCCAACLVCIMLYLILLDYHTNIENLIDIHLFLL